MPGIPLTQQQAIEIVRLINEKIKNLEIDFMKEKDETESNKIKNEIRTLRSLSRVFQKAYKSKNYIVLEDIFENREEIKIN